MKHYNDEMRRIMADELLGYRRYSDVELAQIRFYRRMAQQAARQEVERRGILLDPEIAFHRQESALHRQSLQRWADDGGRP